MQYFPSLPKSELVKWRNLKSVSHFQGMKAIHNQDAPHLRRTISSWDAEVKIPEQKIYSLYFRAFLFMIWRSDPAWNGFLEKADEVIKESAFDRFNPVKCRVVFSTSMWAAALRGNTERTALFSDLAKQFDEPAVTIQIADLLSKRELQQANEMLSEALKAVLEMEPSGFYHHFLRSVFSEEHLAMLDVVPEEALA